MQTRTSDSTEIIKSTSRYIEVCARAGCGKTTVLLKRMLHLIKTGVPVNKILILSFSRNSVRELRSRIGGGVVNATSEVDAKPNKKELTKSVLSKVTVKTAHSFAYSLVNNRQRLLSETEQAKLLIDVTKAVKKEFDGSKRQVSVNAATKQQVSKQLAELSDKRTIKDVLGFLSVTKAMTVDVTAAASEARFEHIRPYVDALSMVNRKYVAVKKGKDLVDYGDMLEQAICAIQGGVSVSVPYTHILVDEYQDCSPAQVHLLTELARQDGRSLMVVGDPSQALYGFSGAHYTPLKTVLPGVQELTLNTSWRLTPQIAALASAVAQLGADEAIQTNREDSEKPVLVYDTSLDAQTKHIVQDILDRIATGVPRGQIVVLARLKALLAPVEQLLLVNGVNTTRLNVARNRKHVLRVLKILRTVNRCEKAGNKVTPQMLQSVLPSLQGVSDVDWKTESLALKKMLRSTSMETRYKQCAASYLRLCGGIRKDPEVRAEVNRWETISRRYRSATAMLNDVRSTEKDCVVTGTIHAAKGGEWGHVYVVGATDGLLPVYLAKGDDKRSIGEERNMLYVAVTRARETLRLYHAPTDHSRSGRHFENVCPFLAEPAARNTLTVVEVDEKKVRKAA